MLGDDRGELVFSPLKKYEEEFIQDSSDNMKVDKSQTCLKESIDHHTAEQLRKIKKNIKYLTDITEKGSLDSAR